MVESDFDTAASATRFSTLVASTKQDLNVQLPPGKVRPLYATTDTGAIVDRQGREVRPPVKRSTPAPRGGA